MIVGELYYTSIFSCDHYFWLVGTFSFCQSVDIFICQLWPENENSPHDLILSITHAE